jgi:glycosyltransferase involved in cell wall biosynthesis
MPVTATRGSAAVDAARRPSLRVAHLIHCLGPGGAENVLGDLARAAPASGIELLVVGLSPAMDPVNARLLRQIGVEVVELGLPRWDPRAISRAVRVLREHQVDLVHSHLKHADLVGCAAGLRLGIPVVSTLHVIEDAPAGRLAMGKRTAGLLARRRFAARTIALSRSQRDWYVRLARSDRRLVVLPNGVTDQPAPDPIERSRLRVECGVADDGLLVVSASLMRPEKGHDLLLDAVADVPRRLPVTVVLAGDGPLRPALEDRVSHDPRLRDRVRFLGYRHDVPALLAAADLVLHTSLADALPTTLIQALSAGTPAVATRVGGIPDIVEHGETGLLVATDPREIAEAVVELAGDPLRCRRLGRASRARFLEVFEAVRWARRLRDVYADVLAEAAQRPHWANGANDRQGPVTDTCVRDLREAGP